MGTAFGMEQWLGERDGSAHPVVVPSVRQRSWLPRWMRSSALRRARS